MLPACAGRASCTTGWTLEKFASPAGWAKCDCRNEPGCVVIGSGAAASHVPPKDGVVSAFASACKSCDTRKPINNNPEIVNPYAHAKSGRASNRSTTQSHHVDCEANSEASIRARIFPGRRLK